MWATRGPFGRLPKSLCDFGDMTPHTLVGAQRRKSTDLRFTHNKAKAPASQGELWVQSVRVSRSMPRPKTSVANSRSNGSKASNKGKIISTKIPVLCPKVQWRGGDPVVTFETVFRAKLHKNEKYKEQVEARPGQPMQKRWHSMLIGACMRRMSVISCRCLQPVAS